MARASAVVERFRFDRNFESLADGNGAPHPAGAAAERLFTSEDVEQARAEGYGRGRAESVGAEEARRESEQLRQRALEDIAAHVRSLSDASTASAQAALSESVLVASAIVRKMMPRLWHEGAAKEIEELVRAVLQDMTEEPRITIRLAPALSGELLPALQAAAAECGAADRLRILADRDVLPGDCRIEWREGGLLRDRQAMMRMVNQVIERSVGVAVLPDEQPIDDGVKENTDGE